MPDTILLTGATGFVGQALQPRLKALGYTVRCGTRRPEQAAAAQPDRDWVACDFDDPSSLDASLAGARFAFYLVHAVGESADYVEREATYAQRFAEAAGRAGVRRIVYLGGVAPKGRPSHHLFSRLETGRILRNGAVETLEMRAGMVVGADSASWRMTRDLAMRLPVMLLPAWLENRSQPVAIRDVVEALALGLTLELEGSSILDVPGVDTLTSREILNRIAALRGRRPLMFGVPFVTPKLSSYWIRFVTGCDGSLARELVMGLTSDLLAEDDGIWKLLPRVERTPFDEAARLALAEDTQPTSVRARLAEGTAALLSRRTP